MENEIMTTETEVIEIEENETESSGNGLKTLDVLALTAAIGVGLYAGSKKIIKKIKERKQKKYVETPVNDCNKVGNEE
jgi:hypothetical protein